MPNSLIGTLAAIFVEPQLPDEMRFPSGAPAPTPTPSPDLETAFTAMKQLPGQFGPESISSPESLGRLPIDLPDEQHPFRAYMKYRDPAFKYALMSHLPPEERLEAAEKMKYSEMLHDAGVGREPFVYKDRGKFGQYNPLLKDSFAQTTAKQFPFEVGGDMLDMGTKAETWLAWFLGQQAIKHGAPLVGKGFSKIAPKLHDELVRPRSFKHPFKYNRELMRMPVEKLSPTEAFKRGHVSEDFAANRTPAELETIKKFAAKFAETRGSVDLPSKAELIKLAKQYLSPDALPKNIESASVPALMNLLEEKLAAPMLDILQGKIPSTPFFGAEMPVTGKPFSSTLYRGFRKAGGPPLDEGIYGKGEYYAPQRGRAWMYGDIVKERPIKLKSPFVETGENIREMGENAISEIEEQGKSLQEIDELISQKITANVKSKGHDGIVVMTNDGKIQEVVVFGEPRIPTTQPPTEGVRGDEITVYRAGDLKPKVSSPPDVEGIYFAEDREMAELFTTMGQEPGTKIPLDEYKITIKNPATDEIENQIAKEMGVKFTEDGMPAYSEVDAQNMADELQNRGYDSIKRSNGEIVVFDKASIQPRTTTPTEGVRGLKLSVELNTVHPKGNKHPHKITATDAEGNELGYALIKDMGNNIYKLDAIKVDEAYQKKGIANSLLNKAKEEITNYGGKLTADPSEASNKIGERLAKKLPLTPRTTTISPETTTGEGVPPAPPKPPTAFKQPSAPKTVSVFEPQPLKPSKVKQQIRDVSGQIKYGDLVREDVALKSALKKAQKASRVGFVAGKEVGISKQKAHYEELKIRKAARDILKKEMNGIISGIQRIPTTGMTVEYQKAINDIKSKYDLKKRQSKTLERRAGTKEYIDRLEADGIDTSHIPTEVVTMIDKVPLNDLTIEDMRDISTELNRLAHFGRLTKKLKVAGKDRDFKRSIEAGTSTILQGKELEKLPTWERNRIIDAIKKPYVGSKKVARHLSLAPELIVEQSLDHGTYGINSQIITQGIINAHGVGFANEMTSLGLWDKMKGDVRKSIKTVHTLPNTRPFTSNEAMKVYAYTLNEHGTQVLRNSGITEELQEDIINALSADEKRVVEQTARFNDEYMGPRIAEVYERDQGAPFPFERGYTTITKLEGASGRSLSSDDWIKNEAKVRYGLGHTGVSKSLTKQRKWHQRGSENFDFYGDQYRTILKAEHYISHREAVRDINRYITNEDFQDALRQKYPNEANDIIRKLDSWLKEAAQGGSQEYLAPLDKLARYARINFTTAAVGINLLSLPKAAISLSNGMEMAGEMAALRGFIAYSQNPLDIVRQANELSPMMAERIRGQDVNIAETMRRLTPYQKAQGLGQDVGFFAWKAVDSSVVYPLWYGTYMGTLGKGVVTAPGHPDYGKPLPVGLEKEKAIEVADYVIRRTQPMGAKYTLPDIYRSGGLKEYAKLNLMFKGYLRAVTNQLYKQSREYGRGVKGAPVKSTAKAARSFLYTAIIPAFIYGLIMRKRLPQMKEFFYDLGSTSLGSILFLGDMFAQLGRGYSSLEQLFTPTAFSPFVEAAKGFASNKPSKVIKAGAMFMGIPGTVQIERTIKGKPFGTVAPEPTPSSGTSSTSVLKPPQFNAPAFKAPKFGPPTFKR